MDLKDFVAAVPGFAKLDHPDKILHFGWYLHHEKQKQSFSQADIRACYKDRHMEPPNLSDRFTGLVARKPKVLLLEKGTYKLEHSIREKFDAKYGQHETTILVSKLLNDLPGKIPDEAERLFLSEAIKCYRVRAFRSSIVMAWNLAYSHLLHWILADPARLAAFQTTIITSIGPKLGTGMTITKREDFEQLKESDVLKISGTAGLFVSMNTKKILDIQLNKRNLAAHPSLLIIGAPEAEDTISSLVQNVVLILQERNPACVLSSLRYIGIMSALIIACVSQKGGVGKSTLARLVAREYAAAKWNVKIADLDVGQGTSFNWQSRRLQHQMKPVIAVERFGSVEDALKVAPNVDLLILDGPPHSTAGTLKIAKAADRVILPTGLSLDDMQPSVLLAHELVTKRIPKPKIAFALCRVGDSYLELVEAQTYITDAGYRVLTGYIPEKIAYRRASDAGRALTETQFPSLNRKTDKLVQSIVNLVSTFQKVA
jgi:chromosome partitioning protein